VSPPTATVLISGTSAAGKERIARAIHNRSPQKARLFVVANCGALLETLIESKLCGYELGASTMATGSEAARIEQADGGPLLLDEVGEMNSKTQIAISFEDHRSTR
jgi:transcriptional regulator with GAF, ATPase, and Fis domain